MKKQDGEDIRPARRRRLDEAIWQARIAQAERSDVVADLQSGELARLTMLEEEVKPIIAQLPEGNDQFDFTLVPGAPPRFWIDMVAFVMMDRDRKTYRFVRDTRDGRQIIAESTDAAEIGARITDYVAHRIVERERAIAGQGAWIPAPHGDRGPATGSGGGHGSRFRIVALSFLLGFSAGAVGLFLWGIYAFSWPS